MGDKAATHRHSRPRNPSHDGHRMVGTERERDQSSSVVLFSHTWVVIELNTPSSVGSCHLELHVVMPSCGKNIPFSFLSYQ